MNHPLKVYFENLHLTPRAFAILNGLSLETIRGFMSGKCRKVPSNIKEALENLGVEIDDLDQKYSVWLEWRANEDIRELRESSNPSYSRNDKRGSHS